MTSVDSFVTVTSYGRGAGSARVRVFDWIDHLGLDVTQVDYLGTSRIDPRVLVRDPVAVARAELMLRRTARTSAGSAVLLSRQASPFSNGGVERALLSRAAHGVYDVDDALFAHPRSAREGLWSKRRTWNAAVAAADVVIAGNDRLADVARERAHEVVIIPSCVEPESYTAKPSYSIAEVPRVVWLGSPSTEHYLTKIADALLQLHHARGLRLTVISAGSARLGRLDAMIDRVEWSPEAMTAHLAAADVGIMPLEDSEWARGKCAYKLLQYGAAALPMIGSPVGANREVLRAAGAPDPTTNDEWVGAIEQIIDASDHERQLLGRRGRALVQDHYSFTAWAPLWRRAVGLDTDY